jgi:hypothetical protein
VSVDADGGGRAGGAGGDVRGGAGDGAHFLSTGRPRRIRCPCSR